MIDMARFMLMEKGLPNQFWAEPTYKAVNMTSRSQTEVICNHTPIEP